MLSYQTVGVAGVTSVNKIPEYAREYKKEWLFIRGINKELKYFIFHSDYATTGLFECHKVDRIKYFIKRFLRGQEKGKLKDISNFEIEEDDVKNIIEIKKKFYNYNFRINILIEFSYENCEPFVNPYPGLENIDGYIDLFFSKLNIKYKERIYINYSDCESDYDSDIEIILPDSDSDSDSDIF